MDTPLTEDAIRSILLWAAMGLAGVVVSLAGVIIKFALNSIKDAEAGIKTKIDNAFQLMEKDISTVTQMIHESKENINELYERTNSICLKIKGTQKDVENILKTCDKNHAG